VGRADGGFYLDGYYHAVLTLDRWPQRTSPVIVSHLTGLPFLDYAITVIVVPGRAGGEINREEKAVERLAGEYAGERRHSLLVALRKKERKIENLAGGFVRPFGVTYVIRIWARSPEVLRDRVRAVQQAIHGMDGAQYLEATLPSTARKLFFATWPGWTHSSYVHRQLYAEDNYLADLLPFSGTFTGALADAEALYDGTNLNLVGVSSQAGGSPQHALVIGMSGSGKSEWTDDLFLQTAGDFAHTLIVDFGGSHQVLTKKLGGTPIVVHPDANLTLNYLDTQGLPLTQLHLATVVALLARMVGLPETAEQLALRQAQISQYVHQLYRDTFTDWSRCQPEKAEEARRLACAVHRWRERMPAGATVLEAFADLRDRRAEGNAEALEFVAGLSEADINRFSQEPATSAAVVQTACAFFSPADHPTHGALVELLAYARFPEHRQSEIERLATLLRAWNADGPYGRLFDGATNVSLQDSIAHFELGLIPEQAVELKAAAGLLISGVSRQHIISLPRASRKRALFEEVSQFMDVPGGEQILAESYAQLRKFNCWAVSVVQQYARFRASPVRAAVIGNAKQFFLLRQSDKNDMANLARDVGLPESAVEAVQQYPLPEQQPEGARYSSVCYFAPTAQPPQCGTLRHYQAKEDNDAS
jgi:type IV secretory pathway VirB4 component